MPRRRRTFFSAAALVAVGPLTAACGSDDPSAGSAEPPEPGTVLFVAGAPATGGFLSAGGSPLSAFDYELSSIDAEGDEAVHGFGQFADLLRAQGYTVEQVREQGGPAEVGADLAGGVLDDVDVLVLGSNNATYGDADVAAVEEFVRGGGGLVVFADANYGEDWGDAADSDSQFLAPFGMRTQQDNTREEGTDPATATDPDHPILEGLEPWGTLGVAAITLTGEGTAEPVILIPFEGLVRENTGPDEGPTRDGDPARDAVLAVAEAGAGRVAAFYDRDLFFDDPEGDGTGLGTENHVRFATQLVDWAAGRR